MSHSKQNSNTPPSASPFVTSQDTDTTADAATSPLPIPPEEERERILQALEQSLFEVTNTWQYYLDTTTDYD